MNYKKEIIKTSALAFLVISSIFLTYLIWYGEQSYEEAHITFQVPSRFNEPRDEKDLISPKQMVVPIEDGEYFVLRKGENELTRIWEEVLPALENAWDTTRLPTSHEMNYPSVQIRFDPPFPAGALWDEEEVDLRQVYSIYIYGERESLIMVEGTKERFLPASFTADVLQQVVMRVNESAWKNVQEALKKLSIEKNHVFFLDLAEAEAETDSEDTHTEGEYAQEDNGRSDSITGDEDHQPDTVAPIPKEIFFVKDDLLVPDSKINMLTTINMVRDDRLPEKMLKNVFVDANLARKIESQDGSIIFTDGDRGLRVSRYLEYSAPRLENGSTSYSYRGALQKAGDFLCYYGGWPDLHYFSKMKKVFNGYYAGWKYYIEGHPVMGYNAGIDMFFNDQGIFLYRRTLFIPAGYSTKKLEVAGAVDAANTAVRVFLDDGGWDNPELRELFLAYYVPYDSLSVQQVQAVPVWVAQINDKTVYLSAGDLTKINIEDNYEYF